MKNFKLILAFIMLFSISVHGEVVKKTPDWFVSLEKNENGLNHLEFFNARTQNLLFKWFPEEETDFYLGSKAIKANGKSLFVALWSRGHDSEQLCVFNPLEPNYDVKCVKSLTMVRYKVVGDFIEFTYVREASSTDHTRVEIRERWKPN